MKSLSVPVLAAVASTLVLSSPAFGTDPPKDPVADEVQAAAEGRKPEVSIPFADRGGIRNWQAIDRDTLRVEGTHGRWYRVELMSGCFDLPFAQRVGFESSPAGDFDRFGTVFVRGQRCAVKSVTEAAPPPKRTKGSKADAAASSGDAPPQDPSATSGSIATPE